MSDMIDLLREVQSRQRIIDRQGDDESDDAFDERVRKRIEAEDAWIGTFYYKGNSVSWSHSKAENYSRDLQLIWEALVSIGIHADGCTHAADAIRKFAVRKANT